MITDRRIKTRLREGRNGWHGTVPPKPTADDIAYSRVILADPCAYCGGKGGLIEHVDHLEHGWTNLTAVCKRCNTSKGQHTLPRHLLAKQLRADRDHAIAQIRLLGDAHGPRHTKLKAA